jgi:hypothetical protein
MKLVVPSIKYTIGLASPTIHGKMVEDWTLSKKEDTFYG